MRFAIIGNAARPLTNFRGPLIRNIVARGHEVLALAPDHTDESRGMVAAFGAMPIDYPLSRTGLNPVADLADAIALRSILARLRLDAVLSFGIKPAIFGTLAARMAGIHARHVLITGLGYAFTDNGNNSIKRRAISAAARLLYSTALRHAQTVFMQNPDDAADFVRMGIAKYEQILTVNGTGVELDTWLASPPITTPVTFLLAARLLRDKGVVEFVEAAREVKSRYATTRFVLIGGVDSNPEAIDAEQISSWVGQGLVEWPGHADMRSWLRQSSVFVLPSYREGLPRSTQEAMAAGKPIVSTDVPGCRETVVDGINGFLVPPRNVEALAAAMVKFIDNPRLIETMGQRSRQLAEERFDVVKINARMIEAMEL